MNTYLRSLYFCFFLLPFVAMGQVSPTASFHMERDGGVKWNECAADIGSIYTITQAKATFGSFYTRYMAEGQVDPVTYPNHTDANFLKINEYSATWNNYVWAGHAADNIDPQTGKLKPCQSRTNIEGGAGNYNIDYHLDYAFGHYKGQGSSVSYHGGTVQQGSTSLVLDVANWVDNPKNMSIFIGATWGREDLSSYQEAFVLSDVRLIGSKSSEFYNPAIESSGILTWDPGSVSKIENVFAEDFNTAGLHCVRGTCLSVENCTWFRNNLAGVWLQGGGMHNFYGVQEFDENPTCFYVSPGHSRDGGSTFECTYTKTESGIAAGRTTDKDQLLLDGEGWGVFHFGTVSYSNVDDIQYTMIRWNGNVNSSAIGIDKVRIWGGLFNIMHDLANNKVCRTDCGTNYGGCWFSEIHDFEWSGQGGGKFQFKHIPLPNVVSNVSDARYESLPVEPNSGDMIGTYGEATGKPAYKYGQYAGVVVPPPTGTPCTGWSTGTWSTCTNGQQTRTVVPAPGGCNTTPSGTKPAESQTCTITPGTWTELWKGTTVTKSTCTPVANKVATQVRLTNWKPSAGGRIVGTGVGKPSVELWNGDFYFNNAKCTSSVGKITLGQLYPSVTITLPKDASGNAIQITIVAAWQVKCESTFSYDGACPGQCTKLEAQ